MPPLAAADPALLEDIARERQVLHRFYSAGLNAYRGEREAWARDAQEVARRDPDNPYFRWFFGAGGR